MTSFYEELNKSSASDEQENALSRKKTDKWIFRLLLILIGIMPIIVMAKVVDVTSPVISTISELSSGTKGDLFTAYKAMFMIAITCIAGCLLLAKVLFMDGTIRKTMVNYVLVIFSFAILISTLLSSNITISLGGQYNRTDGAISWICYIALLFIAMNINYPKKALNYILYSLYPFVIINLLIITMNFYGKDLLQTSAVQSIVSLLLPEGAKISEGSTLVGTLNQWNYMSGMFAIMAVLFLAAALLEKQLVHATAHIIMAAISMAIVFMSLSSSGFLTFIVILPFLIISIAKVKNKKQSLLLLVIFLVLAAIEFQPIVKQNDMVWNETFGIFGASNPYETKEEVKAAVGLFDNKAYAADAFVLPVLPESATSAGSGRLYIWGKTMELLKDKPLFGYGSDSLMYNFPHYNIDARGGLGTEDILADKPHNVYVGLTFGTGIIGLLSMLALVVITVGAALKVAIQKNNAPIFILGAAWVAYLVQSMFNDSLPGITGVAFVLAGIMFAMTLQNKELNDGRDN